MRTPNNCKMCGITVPDGQDICSMCYGDSDYGSDDYYKEYLKEQEEDAAWKEHEQERWRNT